MKPQAVRVNDDDQDEPDGMAVISWLVIAAIVAVAAVAWGYVL